ncbi:MAG: sulfatase [Planctomycetota bacterium]
MNRCTGLAIGLMLVCLWSGHALAQQPHIVVYLSDDHSQIDSSLYSDEGIPTPEMEKMAKAGMTLHHAYVASPTCAPSRAALLTGLMPARNGAEGNHTFPHEDIKGLIPNLKQAGYQVAAFGKVAHGKSVGRYGFDHATTTKPHTQLKAEVLQYLKKHADQGPLCVFVGTSNPHVLWPMDNQVDPDKLKLPPILLDTPKTRAERAAYAQEVIDLDILLGELRTMAQQQLGDNVLFIHTSDHGAQWPFGKWNLYDYGTRVPFLVTWPGKIEPGSTSDAMINWVDILPTLIDAAGEQFIQDSDGLSFLPVLLGKTDHHRKRIFTTHTGDRDMNAYPIRAVRDKRWKLIHNLRPDLAHTNHTDQLRRVGASMFWNEWAELYKTDPQARALIDRYYARPPFELFDLTNDPWEQYNLINEPAHAERIAEMKEMLRTWMAAQGDTGRMEKDNVPHPLIRPETWHPDYMPRKRKR